MKNDLSINIQKKKAAPAEFINAGFIAKSLLIALIIITAVLTPAGQASAAKGAKVPMAETVSATAPFVVKVYPEDGELDVALDTKIMATFNKKMREEDINEFSVTLNDGISDISTTVKYNNDLCKLVVSPLENLQAGHGYYVTISRMVRDLNGTTMVSDKVWKFSTVKKTDKNPPVIVDVSPTVSASGVPLNTKVEVMFNKKMFEPSINENTITLRHGREKIVGAIRYYADVNKAVFAPINPLKPDSLFEVNISPEISDASRNTLARAYSYTFKTGGKLIASASLAVENETDAALVETGDKLAVETGRTQNPRLKKLMTKINSGKASGPEIESEQAGSEDEIVADEEKPGYKEKKAEIIEMFPAPASDMINVDEKIKVKFNKRMNPGTFNIFNFALQDGTEYIFGKIEYNAKTNTAVFTPAGNLKTGRKYRITVSEKIEDVYGERLERDYSWEFTTISKVATAKIKDMFKAPDAGGKDAVGPNVLSTSPKDNEENVSSASQISATFDEAVKDFSLNSFTFRLLDGESEVRGKIYYDSLQKKAIFTPAQPLFEGRAYTAQITGGVMDLSGNYLQREKKWKFIVGKSWNKRSPAIVKTVPEKGETDVDISAPVSVSFDRKMKPSSINPYSFFVTDGVKSVQGRVIYEQESSRAVFAPWSTLLPNKVYNVTLAKTVEDLEGMSLAETLVWQFKTGSGLGGKIAQSNVTSIASGSDANMQIKVQKSMGASDFTNTSPGDPAALEAASELGAKMNQNSPEKTSIKDLVPVAEVAERMSVSDKGAYGNVSAKRVADTIDNRELTSDDSPPEMNLRNQSSDKGAFGNTGAKRIKDTVDKTSVIDDAMGETLKDQIAKFLSDDYKTSEKLAGQIDALASNQSPVSEANASGTGTLNEGGIETSRNFIETPHEAAASFERSNSAAQESVKSNIAENFDGKNKVYTRQDGIIEAEENRNPKSVFTQMSEPPSRENSIYSPNPVPANSPDRQPKIKLSDGEGLVKLEKAEKYDDITGDTAEQEPEPAAPAAQETKTENNPPQPAQKEIAVDGSKNAEKTAAFNPPAAPTPKGMINGVPIEQILADGGVENIAALPPQTGENGSAKNSAEPEMAETPGEFKKVGPGLSDVGSIPRDGRANFFITAIYPNKNMQDVKIDSTITAVFSHDIDASSVNGKSFIISGAEGKVEGKILYNQRMKKVIFRPVSPLAHGVKYDVQLTTAVKSVTGQALLPLNWSFTTR